MTKIEKIVEVAETLSDDQLEGVLAYLHGLAGEPVYATAPAEVKASIEQGLRERDAGLGSAAEEAFARLRGQIDAGRR
jgi:hypothetical protein